MKIGIIGSRRYNNKENVQKAVDIIIEKFGKDNLVIVSGGCKKGGDALGKEVALEKGIKYIEFNPAHESPNKYSGMDKEFYNKPYNVGNYFERNTLIAKSSDYILAFIPEGAISNGTMDTVNKAKKLGKGVKIIN
jgi:predicted Rossmann-fold nucleotide-binding protein